MSLTLRQAAPSDAEDILAIYAPYVRETTVTFEYEVPTLAEFTERMERICDVYPWLVCERSGRILGYAYADLPFSVRSACAWNTDLSIYLAPEAQGQGIGRMLYGALLALLERLGYRNVYGLINRGEYREPCLSPKDGIHRGRNPAEFGIQIRQVDGCLYGGKDRLRIRLSLAAAR